MLAMALTLAVAAGAQQTSAQSPAKNPPPPRSDTNASTPDSEPQAAPRSVKAEPGQPQQSTSVGPNESSSRSTSIDISPPVGDAQEHPDSEVPEELSGTKEFHPWNPHRAEKNIEVGDYYFKVRKNYPAAESRYREALYYKSNDAVATFRLAQVLDITDRQTEAQQYYEAYLKILPHGPYAADAHKALQKLQAQKNPAKDSSQPQR